MSNKISFLDKCEKVFTQLFEKAKEKNELFFALSLSPDPLPYRLSPTNEFILSYDEYMEVLADERFIKIRPRIALQVYCQLAETSGLWEIIINIVVAPTKTGPLINLFN